MHKMKKKFGYKETLFDLILSKFIDLIQFFLLLKNNSKFSNQFKQQLNLKSYLLFEEKKIFFKTGHNRLNWRVKSFYKEEPLMIDWLKEFNNKDIFLDIGANVGTYTIPAISKGAFAYAVELDLINSSVLFENLYLNNFLKKCLILPFGVGKKNSIENIFYRDFSVGDSFQSVTNEQKIPTILKNKFSSKQIIFSLDSIFEIFNLKKPNKIKIDVDGNEMIVFEGGKKIIKNAKEIYLENNGTKNDKKIFNFLLKNGFKIYEQLKAKNSVESVNTINFLFKK